MEPKSLTSVAGKGDSSLCPEKGDRNLGTSVPNPQNLMIAEVVLSRAASR